MLYGLFATLLFILGFFIIIFVLVQQSKSSLGLGSMGGEAQMLFGGSGGQNFFQKATWIMGAIFMALSFAMALMKSSLMDTRYVRAFSSKSPVVYETPAQELETAGPTAEAQASTESEEAAE